MIRSLFTRLSSHFREKRIQLLKSHVDLDQMHTVLDLGGSDGSYFSRIYANRFFLGDYSRSALQNAVDRAIPVQIDATDPLPFKTNAFDFVFCNSVLEHVTGPKEELWNVTSASAFRSISEEHQQFLAQEIRRISKSYWVQVPYKHFPFESHTWLPFTQYLPRSLQIPLIEQLNQYWIKGTQPDFRLFTVHYLSRLFPDAKIVRESVMGLTKSLIAVRCNDE